ncbi:phage minor tail protein L [Escherichia coli]|uniref:phage minor tail protein L n=1 Tax=Escherichia coli TaxID=562 RepID=UPI002078CFEF|nr:phage minor tail protein L [Escherichia coli]
MQPVVWQGVTYEPWPIKHQALTKLARERATSKIQVSNFAGTVSAEVQANDDLVGCRIIRKMTLARFLDAVNFKDGNPTADPNQHFPDEMWFIEQKTLETHQVVEFELSSVFDLMGVQLPYRQIIKNTCPWKYRGPECGYTGPYFDKITSRRLCLVLITAQNVMTPVMRVGIICQRSDPFWRVYWSYAIWVIKQSLSLALMLCSKSISAP